MKQALLLVSAGGRQLAFRMADVIEVQEGGEVHRVPAGAPALRGVTTVRGRLVPQVHLGALLDQGTYPRNPARPSSWRPPTRVWSRSKWMTRMRSPRSRSFRLRKTRDFVGKWGAAPGRKVGARS